MKNVETDVIPDIVMPAYESFSKQVGKSAYSQGGSQNCVYAFVNDSGELHNIDYHYCMSRLNNFSIMMNGKPEAVLIQMQTELNDLSRYHIYYEWLFNYSPWRSAFITKDVSSVMKSRVVVMNTRVDRNLMAGACIAVRHPWESYSSWSYTVRSKMELWLRLVEAGNDPTPSFVFANQMGFDNEGYDKLKYDRLEMNDWYVTTNTVGHQSLACDWQNIHANFIEEKLSPTATYYKSKRYDGPSDAWEGSRKTTSYFSNWLDEHMKSDLKKKTNVFASTSKTSYFKLDQVVGRFKELIPEFVQHVKETA